MTNNYPTFYELNQVYKKSTSYQQPKDKRIKPRSHNPYVLIACSGDKGITEIEILRHCKNISGRNYVTNLERWLNIRFLRQKEQNKTNPNSHFRYFIASQDDAKKIFDYINNRILKGAIHQSYIDSIIRQYPKTKH